MRKLFGQRPILAGEIGKHGGANAQRVASPRLDPQRFSLPFADQRAVFLNKLHNERSFNILSVFHSII